jgi:hypothetical protein
MISAEGDPMGLDSVELIMSLEETFGVEIKDEEAENAVTPRIVIDLIFSKLAATDENTCQTQRAFYVLRKSLVRLLGLHRSEVLLSSPIRPFIPREKEGVLWQRLGREVLARRWPGLVRPEWMVFCVHGGTLGLFVIITLLAHGGPFGYAFGLCVAGMFAAVASVYTRSWKCYIPKDIKTIRDIVPLVLSSDHIRWTHKQVSDLVKTITMDQIGLSESQYSEDGHFIHDFGLDR